MLQSELIQTVSERCSIQTKTSRTGLEAEINAEDEEAGLQDFPFSMSLGVEQSRTRQHVKSSSYA